VSTLAKGRARELVAEAMPTLAEALDRVEVRLGEVLRSREPLLTDIATYLIDAGGKRVRPAVTVLIFRACGGQGMDEIVDVATALELIHSGDFVFSRAFQLCARFEEKLINWAAQACISLTEGEIMQGRFRNNPAVTLEDYLEIISRKTASIFEQGARTAAYLAQAPETSVDAMAQCGFNVGMTFQLVDDLLDVVGDAGRVGKPIGIDLRDGNPSLPVVLAVQRDAEVARIFGKSTASDSELTDTLARIRACGVLEEVKALANEYGSRARAQLACLTPSDDRQHLLALINQLTERAA
jgi:octaprenyl-diphosphate synthase